MPVRALRGATTVDDDTPDQITERVKALMATLFERNGLSNDDVISLVVTGTSDLRSHHPAAAVRAFGLHDVPLLGAQEMEIDGSLGRCIRVLLHVDTDRARSELRHVFLEGAVVLRPISRMADVAGAGRRANVVGLGLIGGSIGKALRARGWQVHGEDVDPARAMRATQLGVVDAVGLDPDAEITFVAVPVRSGPATVLDALERTRGLVTDVGSVKAPTVGAVLDPRFVGGHPMAGSEQEGLDGADAEMFHGAVWVLTPTAATPDRAFAAVASVVSSLGADVVALSPERHDALVAVVSHVPHLTAATLMALADSRAEEHASLLRLAAGGFRDMTRIASGHPAIWPDICEDNRAAIVDTLDGLLAGLRSVRDIVARSDRDSLYALLARARAARVNLPSRVARPEELSELRIPIPDRPGAAAEVFTLAAELGVNIADFEVMHSAEGDKGVLLCLVDTASADLFRGGLMARGFRPGVRRLE